MKRTIKSISLVIILLSGSAIAELSAQNVSDLIINEVLADNPDGITDSYGQRSGWIEILNTSYGTVDFAGCYLSDDKDNLRKYYIPKGDINTRIKPRQLALFFACGNDGKGTFHTNFTIVPGRTLYLVSNDGRTIIDSIEVPSDLKPGKSVSRISTDNKGMEFRTVVSDPTPFAQNGDVNAATKSQIMGERDPHCWIMTVTAICVVFLALFILFIIYKYVGKAFTGDFKKKKTSKPQGNNMNEETALAIAMALDKACGGETNAAIATALHLYFNDTVHDQESFVLTIRPTQSAWASRHFTLRQLPTRKG